MPLKLTLEATGASTDDLVLAVEEAAQRIGADFTSGFDRNETGSFSFTIEGEEDEVEE